MYLSRSLFRKASARSTLIGSTHRFHSSGGVRVDPGKVLLACDRCVHCLVQPSDNLIWVYRAARTTPTRGCIRSSLPSLPLSVSRLIGGPLVRRSPLLRGKTGRSHAGARVGRSASSHRPCNGRQDAPSPISTPDPALCGRKSRAAALAHPTPRRSAAQGP